MTSSTERKRIRELGITIGVMPTGPYNAITDVRGVRVGHTTLIYDEPRVARTGVTVVVPRDKDGWQCFAGYHSFNGCGEMTGMAWVEESGLLTSPIILTNTHQVGLARDALVKYALARYGRNTFYLPVATETWDGWLNDADAFHVTEEHVFAALDAAASGPVAEGNVGGGTGMICHDFKGGIGTASRVAATPAGSYTVGVLVQANYGYSARHLLRVDGVPVGREIGPDKVPTPFGQPPAGSSIIVILATDAPLLPVQCRRLAQRATVGLARNGCIGHNTSGDLFLAFATGNPLPAWPDEPLAVQMLPHQHLNPLFEAAAEAAEEAVLNALTMAETMTGREGRTVHALPLDELQRVMAHYGRLKAIG
ncbi:MAG: P1 family peptidase [Chloroflexi bacterium]|nr:P1 family peptidase [Chloroflexota bacterium]MCI0580830.1 P1 family peptidase [Chloroflexota bacterium]MCI0648176.1 P1 family peptidase [Chloroflexota bacterium]MCI0730318.1 P1 family peptidase [Chloroflexota bacterium]